MAVERERILFIVEAMGGGVFTYVVDLTNELVKNYDVYVAYATRRQTPENYKEYFDERVNLIEVENFGRSINATKDLKAFLEIRKIADEIQPDIIHLHSSKAGALGRWAFNGRKTPLFYTPHGYSFLMANHGFVKRMVYKTIETISAKRYCTTISCSEGEHKESYKLTHRATFVDNGINMKELNKLIQSVEITEEQKEHPFTVFTLGRICYQKNPKQFNEIALALPDVRFVWVGDGELRDELTAPNIEITGWAERKEALKHALQSDVFMLTSLWEGLPMSLLEAMFMKKLCVVSDVIGNRDVIHTGKNGFVCKDTEDFVEAIKYAMEEREQIAHLEEHAYEDVEKKYNTKTMAKRYSAIYDAALEKKMPQRDVVYFNVLSKKRKATVPAVVAATSLEKMAE